MSTWQFVDSIASSPTVRLDLNSMAGGLMLAGEPEVSPPQLRRATVSSMLADGDLIPAAAFANRVVRLPLQLIQATADAAADKLQALARELVRRPGNILRVTIGSNPLFFRTFPAPDSAYQLMLKAPQLSSLTLEIPCEPFAYGLEETLPAVTVYNDPAEGTTLNANPFFEVDASGWFVNSGEGSIARSTAQSHEGVASLLLTPDGVGTQAAARSTAVTGVSPGNVLRASAWMRCAVARSVTLRIDWRDSGGVFLSSASTSISVAANTWTYFDLTGTAPASAAQAGITAVMTGTPPGSNTLFIDEARLRIPGSNGAMYFDIASPKGDVETPLFVQFLSDMSGSASGNAPGLVTGLAVRRRGTPAGMPLVLQAEAMSMSVADTTVQANSALMSGPGSNFVRTTFASGTAMAARAQTAAFPAGAGIDARGTYRAFARVRQNTGADVMAMRLVWGAATVSVANSTITLSTDTSASAPTIKYVDLGVVQIPVGYDPVYDGVSGVELPAAGIFLQYQVQRVSGGGSFDVDCFLFLPADDRAELIDWPDIQNSPTDTFVAGGGPTPSAYCVNVSGQIVSTPPAQISGTGLMITPGRTNRIVLARDLGPNWTTGAGDSITAITTVQASYFPRYLFPLRPVST